MGIINTLYLTIFKGYLHFWEVRPDGSRIEHFCSPEEAGRIIIPDLDDCK